MHEGDFADDSMGVLDEDVLGVDWQPHPDSEDLTMHDGDSDEEILAQMRATAARTSQQIVSALAALAAARNAARNPVPPPAAAVAAPNRFHQRLFGDRFAILDQLCQGPMTPYLRQSVVNLLRARRRAKVRLERRAFYLRGFEHSRRIAREREREQIPPAQAAPAPFQMHVEANDNVIITSAPRPHWSRPPDAPMVAFVYGSAREPDFDLRNLRPPPVEIDFIQLGQICEQAGDILTRLLRESIVNLLDWRKLVRVCTVHRRIDAREIRDPWYRFYVLMRPYERDSRNSDLYRMFEPW